jgi:hypothetical protein
MSHRSIVLLSLGPPLGGFRIAVDPGLIGLNDAAPFGSLERAVSNLQSVLAAHPPDTWQRLARSDAVIGDAGDLLAARRGALDLACDPTSTTGDVVIRASLAFRIWPFGGWAVHQAWHREADGRWVPFTDEELAELW